MAGQSHSSGKRVYVDNAATSWPKSEAVLSAVAEYLRECGATAGRGSYRSAVQAEAWVSRARHALAKLIGAKPNEIALCTSGTHALNAALRGVLSAGDKVVTCSLEHNSLLRPLEQLREELGISVTTLPSDPYGRASLEAANTQFGTDTTWLSLGHASNVTGAVNELSPWATLLDANDCSLLVDASQTLGYIPVDVRASNIGVLAAATHKGLGAIGGTGMLYVREELHEGFEPLMRGGTGRASNEVASQPVWPESVEVGNLNLPGVVSVAIAAEELLEKDLVAAWQPSFLRLVAGLEGLGAVRIVGGTPRVSDDALPRIPVVSVVVDDWDVHDLASILDASFQIETRSGWHCAALVHEDVGSVDSGGTLRFSTGRSTTAQEVDFVVDSRREILGN